MITRIFRGDKWTKLLGSRIPYGTMVEVIRFYPRRRVMVRYHSEDILTMLWCLKKVEGGENEYRSISEGSTKAIRG